MKRILKWFLALFRQAPQPPQPQPQLPQRSARKRNVRRNYVRANVDAPMIQQARDIGRQ
jgi:hypothetical protein